MNWCISCLLCYFGREETLSQKKEKISCFVNRFQSSANVGMKTLGKEFSRSFLANYKKLQLALILHSVPTLNIRTINMGNGTISGKRIS